MTEMIPFGDGLGPAKIIQVYEPSLRAALLTCGLSQTC